MRMPAPDMSPVEYGHDIVERLWDDSEKLEASEEAREQEAGEQRGDKFPWRVQGSHSVVEERVLDMVRKCGCDTDRAVLRLSAKGQTARGYCRDRCRVLAGCQLVEAVR